MGELVFQGNSAGELAKLLTDSAPIASIAAYLDSLSFAECKKATHALDRNQQRKLYQLAADAPPLTFADLTPPDVPARTEIIHHGRNTLPLPGPMRNFEKRMCRPETGGDRAFGYNEGATRWLIGPGYFVAIPTQGHAGWPERGPIVVDYFQVPQEPVVEGWPKVVKNTVGLQFFVFNKTRDFMRKVSNRVSIGAAYKVEKALDHYFVLVRE